MSDRASPTPAAADLTALGSDAWAEVLRAVRTVLRTSPHADDPALEPFRDAPTSRLVAGRHRVALAEHLVADPVLWAAVVERCLAAVPASEELEALLLPTNPVDPGGPVGPVDPVDPGGPAGAGRAADPGEDAGARTALRDARRRLRDVREERDVWRRRAEGADVRSQQLGVELEQARDEVARLRGQLHEAEAALEAAAAERARAVERERRRRDAEFAALEARLADLRREEEKRRTEARRRAEAERHAELDAQRAAAEAVRSPHEDRPLRIVPGRPSRLPRGVAPGTTEAARELLHRGRLVLVDGYNVTKQHQGHLDLETQRTWLVQQMGILARQRGVRPRVIFDGQASGGSRPSAGLRDVEVLFTAAGITADDDIVFEVQATDEPVVVVTDDRELRERVSASGADLVGTRELLGAV